MTPDQIIRIMEDELDKHVRGYTDLDPDDPDYDELLRRESKYLFDKIAGAIEANAYNASAERMKQLKAIDPDGEISIDQAIEYLEDAAARARNK